MSVKIYRITAETTFETDIIDITPQVKDLAEDSGISNGSINLFVPGSTAALTTVEYEAGAVNDLKKALNRIAPKDLYYEHNERWGDGNGYSHVRAAILGPSLQVPLMEGLLLLGTWQQIVLLDFDNRPRERIVLVQIIGE